MRVQARLADARLSYFTGDRALGRRSLLHALQLAEPEQLRLPFVLEQSWIGPVLRLDPELASIQRRLFGRPHAVANSPRPGQARPRKPRFWWSSRSPNANWRYCGTYQAC